MEEEIKMNINKQRDSETPREAIGYRTVTGRATEQSDQAIKSDETQGRQQPPDSQARKQYGGISRLGYWMASIGVLVTLHLLFYYYFRWGGELLLFILAFWLVLTVSRLQNIGKSRWLALCIFVPILNLCVFYESFIYPEGYQDTKSIDFTGRWLILPLVFLALSILMDMMCSVTL